MIRPLSCNRTTCCLIGNQPVRGMEPTRYERFQQEVGEPVGRVLRALRVLQFLPDSQHLARNARYGSEGRGSRLGFGGIAGLETGSSPSI